MVMNIPSDANEIDDIVHRDSSREISPPESRDFQNIRLLNFRGGDSLCQENFLDEVLPKSYSWRSEDNNFKRNSYFSPLESVSYIASPLRSSMKPISYNNSRIYTPNQMAPYPHSQSGFSNSVYS